MVKELPLRRQDEFVDIGSGVGLKHCIRDLGMRPESIQEST
jgi:hypothetical protein